MKKLLCKIAFLCLPYAILILPFFAVGYTTGEMRSLDFSIVSQRKNPDTVVGLAYSMEESYYKKENANYYQAEAVAIGTSRVMQFVSEYFNEDFYNCGTSGVHSFYEQQNFLENLNYTPKVIIVGMDQWQFISVYEDPRQEFCYTEIVAPDRDKEALLSIFKKMALGWYHGDWRFIQLNRYPQNYGMLGTINGDGFRLDGSYYQRKICENPQERENGMANTMTRIENETYPLDWASDISPDSLNQLDEFLQYCTEHEIKVIAFLPPLAPSAYQKMLDSGNYGYLDKIVPAITPIFAKYDMEFFDFTDASKLGVTDAAFLDGFHGSEVVYDLMMQQFLAESDLLDDYVDKTTLIAMYQNRPDEVNLAR